jgi:hypothetical protein
LKSVHQGNHCWTISFPPYMGPMSDVTMLWRLHRADFGHVMSSWHCHWPKVWQISARTKPRPRMFKPVHQGISTAWPFLFLHMGPMSDVPICYEYVSQANTKDVFSHLVHQGNHCWTISFPPYGSNEWCYHAMKAP